MIDQIMAEGSAIQFEQTTFYFKAMPKRRLWQLMDQCRTMLGKDKLDIPGLVKRVQGQVVGEEGPQLAPEEAIQLMLDFISGVEYSFMEKVQDQLFAYCEFTQGAMTVPAPVSGPMEEVALQDVSPFEMYVLMARGLFIYYKKDILYWLAKIQEARTQNAEPDPAPENVSAEYVTAYQRELHAQMVEQMGEPTQQTEV